MARSGGRGGGGKGGGLNGIASPSGPTWALLGTEARGERGGGQGKGG